MGDVTLASSSSHTQSMEESQDFLWFLITFQTGDGQHWSVHSKARSSEQLISSLNRIFFFTANFPNMNTASHLVELPFEKNLSFHFKKTVLPLYICAFSCERPKTRYGWTFSRTFRGSLHVNGQAVSSVVTFPARFSLKGPLPLVDHHVTCQMVSSVETFAADFAGKRPLGGVNFHVRF